MKSFLQQPAANETPAAVVANAADGEATFRVQDGGSFLIPYGEYPHQKGLQIFDREAAEQIVANHTGLLAKMKRLVGAGELPVYIGHPDIPGSTDTDKRAYAWIAEMAVENDGLRLTPRWTAAGEEMIEGGHFRFYSPTWYLARQRTGSGYRPVQLKSVGLTNNPNIPVPALANEDAPEPEIETMNPELLKALGLPEDATLEDALAAIAALQEPPAEEEPPAQEEPPPAEQPPMEEPPEEEEEAENELQAERDALRARVIDFEVAAALADGRIITANEATEREALANAGDFEAAIDALKQRAPQLKTAPKAGDLGTAKTKALAENVEGAAAEERAELVANEYARTNPQLAENERRRIAWNRAAAKNPELFGVKSPRATA